MVLRLVPLNSVIKIQLNIKKIYVPGALEIGPAIKIISDKLKLKILELSLINSSKSFSILFLSIFTKFLYLSNINWFQKRSITNFFLRSLMLIFFIFK